MNRNLKKDFPQASLLSLAFLDYLGVGLIVPIFSFLLFKGDMFPSETSDLVRGAWMGVLLALGPLVQFFFSPILGSLSDEKGRKRILCIGIGIGALSYVIGAIAIWANQLYLLVLYRILFGFSAATMPVVQAAIADRCTKESKGRHFSFYNTALGTGFMFGPALGGILSDSSLVAWFSLSTPFLFGALASIINFFSIFLRFSDVQRELQSAKRSLFQGLSHLRLAWAHPLLRSVFLAFFFFCFGWDYFGEFFAVTLINLFDFQTASLGYIHGYIGMIYALSNAFLISKISGRFEPKNLILGAMVFGGVYLFCLSFIANPLLFWVYLPGMIILVSFFYPMASTVVSNLATEKTQGQLLGVYHSVQAFALVVSPLFSGSLIGIFPKMPFYLGAGSMLLGGVIFSFGYLRQAKVKEEFVEL